MFANSIEAIKRVGKIEANAIINADCLEAMKYIEDESIDMILVDPPYGIINCKWDSIIPLDLMWQQIKRIIKSNGAIVFTSSQPFTTTLISSNIKMFRYELIWDKGKGSNPLLSHKMPMKSHENILVFYKKLPTYNPQMTDGKRYNIPRTGGNRTNTITNSKDRIGFRQKTKDTSKRFPLSILKYSIHCGSKLHPTQKPVDLGKYLIRTYTNPGEIVLDFATGSCAFGVAALQENRKFIGIEKDEKYYSLSKEKLEKILHV